MENAVLSVKNLSKNFGAFQAVDDVTFSVASGQIIGLLGPNGAGKTTTIQMLMGLMTPSQGTVSYFGKDLSQHRQSILKRINHASGYARMPWKLTVWENLDVFGFLYEVPNHRKKIKEIAEKFNATSLLPKKFQDLSAGQMTRVLLIKAFLNDPEIVLLDEPTASLDPDIAEVIRNFIKAEREHRNVSILITSHNMREVEELCDEVIFLNKGKILAIDTPLGLAQKNNVSKVSLMVTDGLKRLSSLIDELKYDYVEQNRFMTITVPEDKIASLLSEISKQGLSYSEIEIQRPSLEDFFISVSKGEIS